jgi:hypothetical protein
MVVDQAPLMKYHIYLLAFFFVLSFYIRSNFNCYRTLLRQTLAASFPFLKSHRVLLED